MALNNYSAPVKMRSMAMKRMHNKAKIKPDIFRGVQSSRKKSMPITLVTRKLSWAIGSTVLASPLRIAEIMKNTIPQTRIPDNKP